MTQITVDEKVRHGKPIIKGTRISVDEVLAMLENRMTYEQIEQEYGLTQEDILAVIKYAASFIHGEEVHKVPA